MKTTTRNFPTIVLVACATSIVSSAVTAVAISRSPVAAAVEPTKVAPLDPQVARLLKYVKVDDSGNVTIDGTKITISGQQVKVNGQAQVSVQSGAETAIKGAIVTIN